MPFPIVAIAASAGGLEAVSELIGALPHETGMAFIVIQHLDPGHESLLPEILAKKTPLPVGPARDGLAVQKDRVYVIPPNATLTLMDGHLVVSPRASGQHHPADILFTSLAEARADRAIGVVLSGGDADGTLGVQAIKHAGGFTFAQEPSSARFPSMPRHAIETGCVDSVLRPHQIAAELVRLGRHAYLSGTPAPGSDEEAPVEARAVPEEESLKRIFRRLRTVHGVDFAHYKRSTLRRRLERRMALQKLDRLADYTALIEADAPETAALYQDFLIRVTTFFRDPEAFENLMQQVFPALREGRPPKNPIRIWVPGCATGEEAYSIAIALVEFARDWPSSPGVQIFGTDVSEPAIEKARAGVYLNIEEQVSSERLQRFFVKQNDHYRIDKSIRDLCIFARHDVTRDPPFSRLDLVSCRNLLIYLDAAAQRRAMQVFHYALRPDGFLLLGPSESVGPSSNLFALSDRRQRIYTRTATSSERGFDVVAGARSQTHGQDGGNGGTLAAVYDSDSLEREADRLLLARFAPASLVVDEALNILQFRGETGPYLEHASGAPSVNLNRVVRPELLVEIAPAIQNAREKGEAVRREGLRLDDRKNVSFEVVPLKRLVDQRGFLILFDDASRGRRARREQHAAAPALSESEKDRRLEQLERENAALQDYLQATMEEHEAVKEELKSAHEEVLSANEEFQSTNEELETAKEELQSTNEELTTTNDELRNRNRELNTLNEEMEKARAGIEHARDFADTIIETVREPLLVLDKELKVVRANQAFYSDFQTRPEEAEDRLFYDIGNGQWNDSALKAGLADVLIRNEPLTAFELHQIFLRIGDRAMELNARKIRGATDRPELILLAIADVTERKARAEGLAHEAHLKDEFLAMLAHELRNPLAPIMHAVQVLRGSTDPSSASRLYDMIERQMRRVVRLVDDLLDVARFSRGLIELRRQPTDFGALVRNTVDATRPRLAEREQELAMQLPDAPVWVNGDTVRIEQLVANLLDNASKYTAAGGRVGVSLWLDKKDAVLRVRDNGIGLERDQLESIFELFVQVDRSLARSGGGLGIGLTLVRRVAELHGGSVEARSNGLGQGSEFLIRLPLIETKPLTVPAIQPPMKAAANGAPRRVLIVDDNADAAETLGLLISSLGHEIATAYDGWTAMEVAERVQPDIALIDIGLPGIDGYELARKLRSENRLPNLHLVALTGYGRQEDRAAALAAGFDAHLVKPADLTALQSVLSNGVKGL